MPTYRFYLLDAAGRVTPPAVDRELPDDIAACDQAHHLVSRRDGPHSAQVWDGLRLVHCATAEREPVGGHAG